MREVAVVALFSALAFAQERPSFEVADVKINKSGQRGGGADFLPGGRLTVRNATMKDLIGGAFPVGNYAVTGGPNWLDVDRFDIIAKAHPDTPEADLRRMLQSLLIERFKLQVHRDKKEMAVYALTVGKNGPKFKESAKTDDKDGGCDGRSPHLTCHQLEM